MNSIASLIVVIGYLQRSTGAVVNVQRLRYSRKIGMRETKHLAHRLGLDARLDNSYRKTFVNKSHFWEESNDFRYYQSDFLT